MTDKEFIRADDLVRDSFSLAQKIYDSGYRPDAMLVLWRGGTPVGIVLHEFFAYKGLETYHATVKVRSYTGIGQCFEPIVEHIEPVLAGLAKNCRVLLVDDICDSGRSMEKVRALVAARTSQIKIATLYYKPGKSQTGLVPDYYMRKTDKWIVFPHELIGLTDDEILAKDKCIHSILHASQPPDPRLVIHP